MHILQNKTAKRVVVSKLKLKFVLKSIYLQDMSIRNMNPKRLLPFLLALTSGILLSLSWYDSFPGLFILIAFIPLLYAEHLLTIKNSSTWRVIIHAAVALSIWTIIDTWWIKNAAIEGLIAAIIIHGSLGSIVFGLFHITKKRLGTIPGYCSLIFFWIAYEHFYTNAEISFPWLTLGNGLAKDTMLIQWYEYTGVLGGSLWILIVNLTLFFSIRSFLEKSRKDGYRRLTWASIMIIVPIIASLAIYHSYRETGDEVKVAVLQPNIDPYNEKFDGMTPEEQTSILLELAEEASDSSTKLIIGPETALQGFIQEEDLAGSAPVAMVEAFAKKRANAAIIVGMTSAKTYFTLTKPTPTARKVPNQDIYYDRYNAALQVDVSGTQVYHKSKLVVGVEKMPYTKTFPFIEELSVNLGGTSGSLGTQDERTIFHSDHNRILVAPAICYESVYGEYFAGWIKNGANIGAVITNDGWWGDTPGYKQHLSYSSIRAIETRHYIVRSANTGISAIINSKGEITKRLGWWQRGYIKGVVFTNDETTFYVRWGDYIGRISTLLALLMLPVLLVNFLKKGKTE